MPRQAADLEEALKKKGGLTLSQLANYDDLITDALVDQVYYWSTIRKLKANYHHNRGVQQKDVCDILQHDVIVEKNEKAAHKRLLQLPGIARFYSGLKTLDEKEHFERHLRKYINIYLPDCPFEVDTTNRYTIMTAEACIKARKVIKKGEQIRYLSGIQVEMSEKEEKELSSRTDFSIVLSSRRKRPSLFLGPARFANHDCDSNARLNTTGPHGIHIVACKDIAVGDEITVTYGEKYFGIDNCECLCATCESLIRNGWDPRGPPLHEDSSDEEESEEERVEVVKPNKPRRVPKLESQSRSPSSLGKRKRETDAFAAVQGDDINLPKKRGRGRPRKYPRPEEEDTEVEPSSTQPSRQRQPTNRFLPRSEDFAEAISRSQKNMRSLGRNGQFPKRRPSVTPPVDALLEKIYNMILNVGDRTRREIESRSNTPKSARAVQSEVPADDDSEIHVSIRSDTTGKLQNSANRCTGHSQSPPSTTRSSPPYARGLSRSPSFEATVSKARTGMLEIVSAEIPKSKLPKIKKERSVSSLRNVINAEDDQMDIYEIETSKAQYALPRRKRDRVARDTDTDELAEISDSSSPSSNNDSSSATSQASQTSSMTSVDSFAAGNIALSICQMLTSDQDEVETGEQTISNRTMEDIEVDPDATIIDEEIEQSEAALSRSRRSQRRSPRKAAGEPTKPLESIERMKQEEISDDEEEKRGPVRIPGDYTLCKALLSTSTHRWVECRNCDEDFVQPEAHQTRIGCPRCERHSKLYGYYWPKTDKEGKFDTEERVLDHRTIHRFIEPEEERNERKGRKTLVSKVQERELSSRQESEESDRVEKRLRNSPRRSESRRKLRATM